MACSGNPSPHAVISIQSIYKTGVLIASASEPSAQGVRRLPPQYRSNADGEISMTLPRGAVVVLTGNIDGLTNKLTLRVPDAESAQLEDFIATGGVPQSGMLIRDAEDELLASKIGTFQFGAGFIVSEAAPGVASVEIAESGSSAGELLSSTVVNLNTNAQQDLYTVSAGKKLIGPLRIVFHSPSVNLSSGGDTLTIADSLGLNAYLSYSVDVMTAVTAVRVFYNIGAVHSLAAGAKVRAAHASAFGSAATLSVDLFGYLVDA